MSKPHLFLIGSSTRALAQQVMRCGLTPGCFDAYADLDLSGCEPYLFTTSFNEATPGVTPAEFQAIVGQTPWIYTGPLENAPGWLEQAAMKSTCWGNTAETNRAVRNLACLAPAINHQNFQVTVPEILPLSQPPDKPNGWLFKPADEAGGWSITGARAWISQGRHRSMSHACGYFQKRVEGPSFGATIASDGTEAVVLGLCRSLHGAPGRQFAYAGSVGPTRSHAFASILPRLTRLARWLCRRTNLRGLWNIDLVLDDRKKSWHLLEINPRPSASMEVLELAVQRPLFRIHQMIFEQRHEWLGEAKQLAHLIVQARGQIEKRVIYAEKEFRASVEVAQRLQPDLWKQSRWADLPRPGTRIGAGLPVMTRICRVAGTK